MECDVCKGTKETYKCDGCMCPICKKCAKLTSSEVRVLELGNRVLKFYCSKCRRNESFSLFREIIENKEELIKSKERIIEDKDEIINLLKKEIEELKNKNIVCGNSMSYSEIVKKQAPEVLVIKPKKTSQQSSKTKQAIEEKIDPSSLGGGISRVKYIKDGGVAISCSGQQDMKSISDDNKKQLGQEYEVNIPGKKIQKF